MEEITYKGFVSSQLKLKDFGTLSKNLLMIAKDGNTSYKHAFMHLFSRIIETQKN